MYTGWISRSLSSGLMKTVMDIQAKPRGGGPLLTAEVAVPVAGYQCVSILKYQYMSQRRLTGPP